MPCSPGQPSQVGLKLVTGDTPAILSSPRAGVKGLRATPPLPWAAFHAGRGGDQVAGQHPSLPPPNICSGKSLGLHFATRRCPP